MWGYSSDSVIVVSSFDVGLLVFKTVVFCNTAYLFWNITCWANAETSHCRDASVRFLLNAHSVVIKESHCSYLSSSSSSEAILIVQNLILTFFFYVCLLSRQGFQIKHLNVLYCRAGESQENILTDNISFGFIVGWKNIFFHFWLMCNLCCSLMYAMSVVCRAVHG